MAKKQVIKYSKAASSKFNKKDVQIIGPELARIFEGHGESKPEVIVDEARSKKSPLHPYFMWNQKEAARRYNIEEAKYMLRNIQIEVIAPEGKVIELNIASSVTRPGIGHVYQMTNVLLGNKSDRTQLLENAWNELRSFVKRYSDFSEFEEVFHLVRLQVKKHGRK